VSRTIGFIGLGIMGRPMARNLVKAGYRVVVFSRSEASMAPLVAEGALKADSARQVAEKSEVLITMLPDGPDVRAVVLGAGGVLEGAAKGLIVVDMSSISPIVSQEIAAACEDKGVEFLDAPVSGGEHGAIAGTLAIMAGGKAEALENVRPILQTMGSAITHAGPAGAGSMTKLANQIMVACNIAGVGEALALSSKAGLDPEVVFNAVKGGMAGGAILNVKAPAIFSRNFQPGFRLDLHHKDLKNALSAAEELKVPLMFTSLVQSLMTAMLNQGKGDLDHCAIVNAIEEMASVEIRKRT
jgi:2-hydroxy-3-oxopropionate reductase